MKVKPTDDVLRGAGIHANRKEQLSVGEENLSLKVVPNEVPFRKKLLLGSTFVPLRLATNS
jgi:hypothetical protein